MASQHRDRVGLLSDAGGQLLYKRRARQEIGGRLVDESELAVDLDRRKVRVDSERLYLASHYRKAPAGIAGAVCLDIGVDREQVCLGSDALDEIERLRDVTHQRRKGLGMSARSEEHTSELQSLMRNSYAVFCLKK